MRQRVGPFADGMVGRSANRGASRVMGSSARYTMWRLVRLAAPFWRRIILAALLGFATIGSSVGLMTTAAYIIAKAALRPSIADLQVEGI